MDIRKVITNLDDDEAVRGVYHQFPLVYFWQWLGGGLVFLSPFFFLYLFLQWGATGSGLFISLFVLGALWLFRTWRRWYYGVISVTDKRVIIIRQHGLLDRTVSQVDLDKIYDVTYRRKGILQTMFNVGILYLTPGNFEKVELGQITDPAAIQKLILKTQQEFMVTLQPRQFSEQDLQSVISEIRTLVGDERWQRVKKGGAKEEQELIREVSHKDREKARAIAQFFGREDGEEADG
ncbi:MAG: PH domain-containing protein [Parcubacteria group bacterium]|nr:PH domain-containing protein [Parcubacteria group bacterium]